MLADPTAASGLVPTTGAEVAGVLRAGPQPALRKGSLEHAQHLRAQLQQLAGGLVRGRHRLEGLLTEARRYRIWTKLYDPSGVPFSTIEAFSLCPRPFGLGYSLGVLEDIIRERRSPAAAAAAARSAKALHQRGEHRRPGDEATRTTTVATGAGTCRAYWLALLARDHPEHLERLQRGEYRSVFQAAKAAGLASPQTTVRCTPMSFACQAWRHLGAEGVAELLELLRHPELLTSPFSHPGPRRARAA